MNHELNTRSIRGYAQKLGDELDSQRFANDQEFDKLVESYRKKAVRISLSLRYQQCDAQLYPDLGELYSSGYTYSKNADEDYFVATESLEDVHLDGDEDVATLRSLGFAVYDLQEDGTLQVL